MNNLSKKTSLIILVLFAFNCSANISDIGDPIFQVGSFRLTQGQQQLIEVNNAVGEIYTATNKTDTNILFGIGYYFKNKKNEEPIQLGLNAFYLPKSSISGTITQERVFTNLAYKYKVSNLPIYASIRSKDTPVLNGMTVNINAGVGPNFIFASDYIESSLDGVTNLNNAFQNKTTTTLSGTVGIGFNFSKAFYFENIHVSYQYFALGSSKLKPLNSQVKTDLGSGFSYAHALMITLKK